MKRNWYKQCLLLSCAGLVILGACVGPGARKTEIKTELLQQSDGEKEVLEVTFFNVGKGDAILIDAGEESMLIDTGFDDTAEQLIMELKDRGIRELDYLVITHFDKDHVGGADKILEDFQVDCVLQPDYKAGGRQYKEYKKMLKKQGLAPEMVTDTGVMELGDARVLVYPPQKKEYESEDNDWSLVISLLYGEKSFLFAGDSEEVRLQELMEQEEFSLEHSVLKAPHHGIKAGNSGEFLKKVSPEVAVITCKDEWKTWGVQKTLYGLGSEAYLTSRGSITCITDGRVLFVEQ